MAFPHTFPSSILPYSFLAMSSDCVSRGVEGTDCILIKFAHHTRSRGLFDTLEGWVAVLTGWRDGPRGTLWTSTRTSAKCCTWEGRTTGNDTSWGLTGWEELCAEGLECTGSQKAEREPVVRPSSRESILSCVNRSAACRLKKVVMSLYRITPR